MSVSVCPSSFSNKPVKPALSLQHQDVPLWFLYGWTSGRSACYRSRSLKARRPCCWLGWQGERHPIGRVEVCSRLQSARTEHCSAYSGGGRRLCSFRSSRPFQYLKLLSKCCIRLGRSAKAGEMTIGQR